MGVKEKLSRKSSRAKNGEGRQSTIKYIPIPSAVHEKIQLCINAYSVVYRTKVTYEKLLMRWIENFGRIDPKVYEMYQLFLNESTLPQQPDEVNEEEAQVSEIMTMPYNLEDEESNNYYFSLDEQSEEDQKKEQEMKRPYLITGDTQMAVDTWITRQADINLPEIAKTVKVGDTVKNDDGAKLYISVADLHYRIFKAKNNQLMYRDYQGCNKLVKSAKGTFFWM